MNTNELLVALAGVPGVRALPAPGDGLAASALVSGIEVARSDETDERAIRRVWRDRAGGGPTPLLVISDDPVAESCVQALGPAADGLLRIVPTEPLLRVLERLPAMPSLQAVRELAEELHRLDRSTGVSGLQVRGLGTEHLFGKRIRDGARWRRLTELAEGLPGDWRPLLEALGYELERLPRGYLIRHDGHRVAIVRPLADPGGFARLDAEGRPPEGVLIDDCRVEQVPYGLLASGGRFRLFEAEPASGSAVARYLELDAASLPPEARPLLGLLAPEYLAEGGFNELMREARAFGSKLRARVDKAIRHDVLPALGRELGRWAQAEGIDLADDARRAELEAAALTFVFRALFLLYAESAGHLPVTHEAYRPHSLSQIVREAAETRDELGARSTTLWDRVALLVKTLREGNPAWQVPAYNGALFARDGFEGAEVLERAAIPDAALGRALVALGYDEDEETGFDLSGLEIGHLGHIYEGLLSLRLSIADRPYRYDLRSDRYVEVPADAAEIEPGELLWLTDEGGRKGGGVYYTPEPLVRHLVRRGVVPAFERHLEEVERLVRADPAAAARKLFEFHVLDPACGSAHFLVAVVDELADLIARFLARFPLPAVARELDDLRAGAGETYGIGVEDVALLRRLVLKRCVHGVDLSPMGAEIAKISLWLASFVPGLALTYLDHNVKVGNSLIGAADESGFFGFALDVLNRAIDDAREAETELLEIKDRTPDEVEASKRAEQRLEERTAKARTLLDLWVAEPLGLPGARDLAWGQAESLDKLENAEQVATASALAREHRAFHWPIEFPQIIARGGFDAVVGNPPWDKVMIEEHGFYGRYVPGLRGMAEAERLEAIARIAEERPELPARLEKERSTAEAMRAFFGDVGTYEGAGGHPDLFKLFTQRYPRLLRREGALSVVLPRTAFANMGSTDFRSWLFERTTVARIDFLVNSSRWAFDAEPRYTVALVVANSGAPPAGHMFEVAGVADSAARFAHQASTSGLAIGLDALGPLQEVPLLRSQPEADLLTRLRASGTRFPFGTGRWRCFATQELNETTHRGFWQHGGEWQVWKGESFDQYDPNGAEARACSTDAMARAEKSNPGKGSMLAKELPRAERVAMSRGEVGRARVAFRDVSRANDSRTVRAVLVPPEVFLTHKAPYLSFDRGNPERAGCLAIMNSLAFDWQARRFVETNLTFFILEGLQIPELTDETYDAIGKAAARLSCPDERFADFASAAGVEVGPLEPDERERLRADIDARVARAWGLDADDLETIFADFTLDALPEAYRERVRARFRELSS